MRKQNYPSPLNATRCCEQPICTECFVQIRRADPNATNPPSSQPAACPYCQADHFGVVYHPPPALLQGCRLKGGFEKRSAGGLFGHRKTPSGGGGSGSASAVGGSALDSGFSIPATAGRSSHAAGEEKEEEQRAERDELPTPADMAAAAAAGESLPTSTTATADAAGSSHRRRKSFGHLDPEVVTVDAVRPDWSAKLAAAQATIARRANRRLIMRQVGERLIPVGISSSRLGQELPMGTGPGGAIILQEGESLVLPPGFETTGVGSGAAAASSSSGGGGRRRSSGRALFGLVGAGGDEEESAARRESRRQGELARYLIRQGNAQDVEDVSRFCCGVKGRLNANEMLFVLTGYDGRGDAPQLARARGAAAQAAGRGARQAGVRRCCCCCFAERNHRRRQRERERLADASDARAQDVGNGRGERHGGRDAGDCQCDGDGDGDGRSDVAGAGEQPAGIRGEGQHDRREQQQLAARSGRGAR